VRFRHFYPEILAYRNDKILYTHFYFSYVFSLNYTGLVTLTDFLLARIFFTHIIYTLTLHRIRSFLTLYFPVTPFRYLNIFISVTFVIYFTFLYFFAILSDPYNAVGIISLSQNLLILRFSNQTFDASLSFIRSRIVLLCFASSSKHSVNTHIK